MGVDIDVKIERYRSPSLISSSRFLARREVLESFCV